MSLDERLHNLGQRDDLDVEEALSSVHRKAGRARRERQLKVSGLAAALVIAAVAVPAVLPAGEQDRGPATPIPATSVASRPTCDAAPADSTLVAYSYEHDLWLYDVERDEVKRLTDDGQAVRESSPRFLGGDCVVYTTMREVGTGWDDAIEVVSIAGGGSRVIADETGTTADFDISPDGRSLVYIHINYDSDEGYRVKRARINDGHVDVLREFAPHAGRGSSSEDDVSVQWQPRGESVLVVNTVSAGLEGSDEPTIFVLDQSGKEVRAGWRGTGAQWTPDGSSVVYRGIANDSGNTRWRMRDVSSGLVTELPQMSPGTNNVALSPDGRYAAHDTTYVGDHIPQSSPVRGQEPTTYLYDFRTGEEIVLQPDAMAPVWVSAREVLVTHARKPEPGASTLNSFEPLGIVTKITIGGAHERVSIPSTLWDAAVSRPG